MYFFFYLIEQHSKFLLHTLQVLYMCTLCDSTNINTIIEFVCTRFVSHTAVVTLSFSSDLLFLHTLYTNCGSNVKSNDPIRLPPPYLDCGWVMWPCSTPAAYAYLIISSRVTDGWTKFSSAQLAQCICYISCSVGVQEINTLPETEVVECLACLSGSDWIQREIIFDSLGQMVVVLCVFTVSNELCFSRNNQQDATL